MELENEVDVVLPYNKLRIIFGPPVKHHMWATLVGARGIEPSAEADKESEDIQCQTFTSSHA